MEIRNGGLSDPKVAQLLREHLESMAQNSPPESVHALNVDGLRKPEVTFWSVWSGAELLGCGALKELSPEHGEIKSMRTSASHRREGVATALLNHILYEAKRRSYRRMSLETGSADTFIPAHNLYAKFGFRVCEPFAEYVDDPFSVFMTREM